MEVLEPFIDTIKNTLTENEKKFLLSIKQGQLDWELMSIMGINQLPAIQWKLMNIRKMKKEKHAPSTEKLRETLG